MTIYSKKSGVYKIECNDKVYIGAARNINKRIKAHMRMLKDGSHYNQEMQSDYDLGKEFKYEELIHCSVDELNENELYFMEKYDSLNSGYNIVKQGHSKNVGMSRTGNNNPMYNKNHTQESKDKIADFRRNYTGWEHSKDTKAKMSESAKKRWSNVPKKKYRARIRRNGQDISLGSYATKEERDEAIKRYNLGSL